MDLDERDLELLSMALEGEIEAIEDELEEGIRTEPELETTLEELRALLERIEQEQRQRRAEESVEP